MSSVKARYSAVVSAVRGAAMRSMTGSSARLMNRTEREMAPVARKSAMKNSASSKVVPMAQKTTAKPSPVPRTRAWRAICAATRAWGRPEPLKSGSFCPRTSVFSPSIVEIPVWMNSFG